MVGEISDDKRSSSMWYVFFARPEYQELYGIALNADLYSREEMLALAKSVHFTEKAWDH